MQLVISLVSIQPTSNHNLSNKHSRPVRDQRSIQCWPCSAMIVGLVSLLVVKCMPSGEKAGKQSSNVFLGNTTGFKKKRTRSHKNLLHSAWLIVMQSLTVHTHCLEHVLVYFNLLNVSERRERELFKHRCQLKDPRVYFLSEAGLTNVDLFIQATQTTCKSAPMKT